MSVMSAPHRPTPPADTVSKLQLQWRRLYLPLPAPGHGPDPAGVDASLIDADGQVRALVLGVAQQAGWNAVAGLWQGVQDDWAWPAPAIAVDGSSGYQVWFSLLAPVPVAQAQGFLACLCQRYLGTVVPRHLSPMPLAEARGDGRARHTCLVPALQAESGRWSAFVAPGLASMFAQEPWLDLAPSPDAQAGLLAGLVSIKPAEFERVLQQLSLQGPAADAGAETLPTAATQGADQRGVSEPVAAYGDLDPKGFLLAVMNDPAVALPLRLEAAKALLPYADA